MSNYLEEALELARKALPGWAYAFLKQASLEKETPTQRNQRVMRLAFAHLNEGQISRMTPGERLELSLAKESVGHKEPSVDDTQRVVKSAPFRHIVENIEKSQLMHVLNEAMQDNGPTVLAVDGEPLRVTLAPTIFALVTDYWNGVATLSVLGNDGELVHFGERVVEGTEVGAILELGLSPDSNAVAVDWVFAPSTMDEILEKSLQKATPNPVDLDCDSPKAIFMSYAPSELESARGRAFVGEDREVFEELYLKAFGLAPEEVGCGFCIPVHGLEGTEEAWAPYVESLKARYPGVPLVAVGKMAKEALGEQSALSVPHPSTMAHEPTPKQERSRKRLLANKAKALENLLDLGETECQDSKQETDLDDETSQRAVEVQVRKASEPKRIVYGVVLDPYEIDAHGDWLPPGNVEATAHQYMSESRVVGLQHTEEASASVVESFIETYPTHFDYMQAMSNMPHRVSLRDFGNDVIKSGSWVLGVKLSESEWELYQQGKLTGFSIGAMTSMTQISSEAMPEVEFVRLVEGKENA